MIYYVCNITRKFALKCEARRWKRDPIFMIVSFLQLTLDPNVTTACFYIVSTLLTKTFRSDYTVSLIATFLHARVYHDQGYRKR